MCFVGQQISYHQIVLKRWQSHGGCKHSKVDNYDPCTCSSEKIYYIISCSMSRTTSNSTYWRFNSEFQLTTCLIVVNDVYDVNGKYSPPSHLQHDKNFSLKYKISIRYIRFEVFYLRGKASCLSSVMSPLITHDYVMKFLHIKSELHKQACIPVELRTLSTKNVYLSHLFP